MWFAFVPLLFGLVSSLIAFPVHAVSVAVGSATGALGTQVTFDVTLNTGGASVAGLQLDIGFDPSTPVAAQPNGRPNCTVNPAIDKGGTSFSFQPSGCTTTSCTRVRVLVLSVSNTDPIPDGSVLFTCKVNIAPSALLGRYPLTCSGSLASNPSGGSLVAACTPGEIIVAAPSPATATPTRTPTPTATTTATSTATVTPTPSPTPIPCVGDCDGSRTVAVNELILGVNIALGKSPLSQCPSFDRNGDGDLAIEELILGVRYALDGCPP